MANDPSTMFDGMGPSSQQIKQDVSALHKVSSRDPSTGPAAFGLSIARVVRVDYAKHQLALQIMTGERDIFDWTEIPSTCAAAGNRHFIGAMPEPGDVCVVGYLATDNREPVILTWLPTGTAAGMEWLPVQDFLPSEVDVNPKVQAHFEGIYGRYRPKQAPVRPGCLFLSSSQGSDIHLDENVLISNRRANEIRLRDADQAIVFRSMQQFHAMGGARIYGGMVQRDAQFLPRRMLSDGTNWAAKTQQDENGDPIMFTNLGSSAVPEDQLTPHPVFFRSDPSSPFADSGIRIQDNVDPYSFLSRGLFIGPDGVALDSAKIQSSAEYAGKPIFRVAIDPDPASGADPSNGMLAQEGSESDTLTEYRIELDHAWDGTLPVTEQTDNFDADRLPSDSVQGTAMSSAGPFIEWVLGSVVGNNPFTTRGAELYGLPLMPIIFDGDRIDPRLESGIGSPLGEHAASLFKVMSPVDDPSRIPPMFVTTTKDGRVKGFLSGPQNENSLELAANGGMRFQSNGPMVFDAANITLKFRNATPLENWAFALDSDTGAILIRGNAPTTRGSFSSRTTNSDLNENQLPAVAIESPSGNIQVTAGRVTKISGANAVQITDTDNIQFISKKTLDVYADGHTVSVNTMKKAVQGREDNLYGGPKNFSPTNAPLRITRFTATPLTGHAGGDTDEYRMVFGNRDERFRVGDHSTTVLVGNQTYECRLGTITHRALANSITIDSSTGISATSVTTTTMTSTLATSITALASLTLKAQTGVAKLSGISTTLGGTGKVGRIVSSADRDPLTGLLYSVLGLGSAGHRIGLPI